MTGQFVAIVSLMIAILTCASNTAWAESRSLRDDVTFGMRGAFHAAFSKQDYVKDRLAVLEPGSDLARSGGMLAAFFVSYRRVHVELELYLDSKLAQVNDADSVFVEVEPVNATVGGWLRYAVYEKEFGEAVTGRFARNRLSIMPGASVAYTSLSVDGWPADFSSSPRSLLEKKGTTFAVGVLAEWLFFKGLGASVDYRYRFARMSDAVPENEGLQLFDNSGGTPSIDFSGHMISFAMLYRASLNLFGDGRGAGL